MLWLYGNQVKYSLFVNDDKFKWYVRTRTEVKNIHTKWKKWKFLRELNYPGFLGLYLREEGHIMVNCATIYRYHKHDYLETIIDTIVHETLHHVFHTYVGHHNSEEQEYMIADMGYYKINKKYNKRK